MAEPRSLARVSVPCCRKPDRSTRSDTGPRRGADCTAELCRRSWDARKARCSCRRGRHKERLHRCRRRRPIRHDRRTQHRRHGRRTRRHSGPRYLPRLSRRSIPTHHLRPLRREAGKRRRGSRRRSTRRYRARNPDTRLGWPRRRPHRHFRHALPTILPRQRFRRCRRHLFRCPPIRRQHPDWAARSIHTLRSPATEGKRGFASS